MSQICPSRFQSIQDYLLALRFEIIAGQFVRGQCRIDPQEFALHTPLSFSYKAQQRGWFDEPTSSTDIDYYQWGNQFIFYGD